MLRTLTLRSLRPAGRSRMTVTVTLTRSPESSSSTDSTVPEARREFQALPYVRLASDADMTKCAFAFTRAPARRSASVVLGIATARLGKWRRRFGAARVTQRDLRPPGPFRDPLSPFLPSAGGQDEPFTQKWEYEKDQLILVVGCILGH
jgi:hypothetical protein